MCADAQLFLARTLQQSKGMENEIETAADMWNRGYDEFEIAEHLGKDYTDVERLLDEAFPQGWDY